MTHKKLQSFYIWVKVIRNIIFRRCVIEKPVNNIVKYFHGNIEEALSKRIHNKFPVFI